MSHADEIPRRVAGVGRASDRRGERLATAWVHHGEVPATQGSIFVRDVVDAVAVDDRDDVVLAMLSGACPSAERAVRDAAARGARVYVLAHEAWGAGEVALFASAPKACVLVRRVARPPVTAICGSRHAWLWFGDDAAAPAWRMALDLGQREAMRAAFLRMFWHDAIDEGMNRDGVVAFGPCGARPFDVPEAPRGASVVIAAGVHALEEGAPDRLVYVDSMAMLPRKARRVWLSTPFDHHERLAEMTRAGVEVVSDPRALPRCHVDREHGALMPRSARWSMTIRLDAAQREALAAILAGPASWRFRADIALGDIEATPGARVQLPGSAQAAPLTGFEALRADDVRAESLRACATAAPTAWPTPHPLSLSVAWQWEVIPPGRPRNGKDAPLVESWRGFDDEYAKRVRRATESLAQVRDRQGPLAKTFATLKAALLGFERTRERLDAELARLAAEVPSRAGPERAGTLAMTLLRIEPEVSTLAADLDKAEREAREASERDEQRAAFDRQREQDRRDRLEKSREFESKRTLRGEIEAKLAALGGAADGSSETASKDREAARKRLGDELSKMSRHIALLEGLLRDLDRALQREFVFQPTSAAPKKSGGGFVPSAAPLGLHAPANALPSVGRLLVADARQFLAIARWSELDDGEREARRLNASLVADLETP